MTQPGYAARIDEWVRDNRNRVCAIAQGMVRIASENHPPDGNEAEVQYWLAERLRQEGFEPDCYDIATVPGLEKHPLRQPDVNCAGRPNVSLRLPGRRPEQALSLILSGHADTVPAGPEQEWDTSPVSGHLDGQRLYGRGAYDMKAGVAANVAVALMLRDLNIELDGDLIVESVADEEFAGGHGTLAARLKTGGADAVLLPEPSNLIPYRAHRGLRLAQMTIEGKGGVTFAGDTLRPPAHDLARLIDAIVEFGKWRNATTPIPEAYSHAPEPANWMITKVKANDWTDDARLAVPDKACVELFWETMPGETRREVEQQFEQWLGNWRDKTGIAVTHQYRLRWMDGYQLPAEHPLAHCAESMSEDVLGIPSAAVGAPFPCDLFLFAKLGVPAGIILGPTGNNAHAANEWVDLESVMQLIRIYARIVCDWCNRHKTTCPPTPSA